MGRRLGRPQRPPTQAIAAFDVALWDLKAKRAGLPLAKLLGAHRDSVRCYNTSGGFLSTPIDRSSGMRASIASAASAASRSRSASPTPMIDLERVEAVRKALGDACR